MELFWPQLQTAGSLVANFASSNGDSENMTSSSARPKMRSFTLTPKVLSPQVGLGQV